MPIKNMPIKKINFSLIKMFLPFILALFLSACTDYSDPNIVSINYVKSVYNNDVKDFKKLIEEKHYKSTKDYEWFIDGKSTGRETSRLARNGIDTIDITDTNITNNKASIKITVTFMDATSKNIHIYLHKNNSRWYVDPMVWSTW